MKELERFESKVCKTENCHLWEASVGGSGYGQFYTGRVKFSAHRKAYELYIGDIPKGMLVCHSCDNKRCVNPEHLFLGSQQDNIDDKIMKGRHPRGDFHVSSKLSETKVKDIKRMIGDGFTHSFIASAYGVARSTISMAASGANWGNLT